MSAITTRFESGPSYGLTKEIEPVTVEIRSSGALRSLTLNLHSDRVPEGFAVLASNEEEAHKSLVAAGYDIGTSPLTRKLDGGSAEGFWDITIDFLRMVCYGPGEYVQPHYHDIDETFTIKSGGCYVWTSQDAGKSWDYNYCGKGELIIPGGAWHCLVAGPEGLCMDVYRDHKRSINWLDGSHSAGWRKDLSYVVTIQDIEEATRLALCSI